MRVSETLVMAQVEISFRAIVSHKDFSVLKRRHRAGIDVDVRIEFDQGDPQASALEQATDRRRCQALTKTRNHTTSNEDVFRHLVLH